MGFLPVRSIKNLYYLCRSCRVDLSGFELSSENKRVLKKLNGINPTEIPIENFINKENKLFDKDYLTKAGTRRIFSSQGNFNKVMIFGDLGYVALKDTDEIIHYAHQFYKEKSIGMAGMTSVVQYAKGSEKKYAYLGTCYGKSALYKTQFAGFEFFDGLDWSNDLEKLKFVVGMDGNSKNHHLLQNEEYLDKFYKLKKLGRLIKKLQNE